MNNEMIYNLFLSSISKMNDDELNQTLVKAKSLLSEEDYSKLCEIINKQKENNSFNKSL